jgi:hypothetical protein
MFKQILSWILAIQLALPHMAFAQQMPPATSAEDLLTGFSENLIPDLSSAVTVQSFALYLKSKFHGASNDVTTERIQITRDILQESPDLQKPNLARVLWKEVRSTYAVTPELRSLLELITKATGRWKALLIQPQANVGEWIKLKIGNTQPFTAEIFKTLMSDDLVSVLSKKDRTNAEILAAYRQALGARRQQIGEEAYRKLYAALIHVLVATDTALQANLKSPDGLTAINAARTLIAEREQMAKAEMQMNYDQISQFSSNEKGAIPSNAHLQSQAEAIEASVRASPVAKVLRKRMVRSLSLAESGFRSCLADDCATRTYFQKAFDPNFVYFTMQDDDEGWRGHFTVVLGTASGARKKVAFLDKVQGVEDRDLPGMIEAARLSLAEYGYELVIPENLGGHNGISNSSMTTAAIKVLPAYAQSQARYGKFIPHPTTHSFRNAYSRSDEKLKVRAVLQLSDITQAFETVPSPAPRTTSGGVSLWHLIEMNFALKAGSPEEQIKYINVMELLEQNNLPVDPEFFTTIHKWLTDKSTSIKLRYRAMTYLLRAQSQTIENYLPMFTPAELKTLVQNWAQKEKLNRSAVVKNVYWRIFADMGPSAASIKTFWTDVNLTSESWDLFKDEETLKKIHARAQLLRNADPARTWTEYYSKAISFLAIAEALKIAVDRNMIASAKELESLALNQLEELVQNQHNSEKLAEILANALQDSNSPVDEALLTKLFVKKADNLVWMNKMAKSKLSAWATLSFTPIAIGVGSLFFGEHIPIEFTSGVITSVFTGGWLTTMGGLFGWAASSAKHNYRESNTRKISHLRKIWDEDVRKLKAKLQGLTRVDQAVPSLEKDLNSEWKIIRSTFDKKDSTAYHQKQFYLTDMSDLLSNGKPVDPELHKTVYAWAADSSDPDLQMDALIFLMKHENAKLEHYFSKMSDADLMRTLRYFAKKELGRTQQMNVFWRAYAIGGDGTEIFDDALAQNLTTAARGLLNTKAVHGRVRARAKYLTQLPQSQRESSVFGKAIRFVVLAEGLKAAIDANNAGAADEFENKALAALDEMINEAGTQRAPAKDALRKILIQSIYDDGSKIDEVLVAKLLQKKLSALTNAQRLRWAKAWGIGAALTSPFVVMPFVPLLSDLLGLGNFGSLAVGGCAMLSFMGGVSGMLFGLSRNTQLDTSREDYRTLKELWAGQYSKLKKLVKAGTCQCSLQ